MAKKTTSTISDVAKVNLGFISDCLREVGIDTEQNNTIIVESGCVMIATPEETASSFAHVRELCCRLDRSTMERGLAVIDNALKNRTEAGSNG